MPIHKAKIQAPGSTTTQDIFVNVPQHHIKDDGVWRGEFRLVDNSSPELPTEVILLFGNGRQANVRVTGTVAIPRGMLYKYETRERLETGTVTSSRPSVEPPAAAPPQA